MIYFWGYPGGASGKEQWKSLSHIQLFATPQTIQSNPRLYSPQPRDRTQISHVAGGSLPLKPTGKPTCQYSRLNWLGFDPWMGRSPGGGQGDLLQYSCLENPIDREACQATVHRVSDSRTWLKWLGTHCILF